MNQTFRKYFRLPSLLLAAALQMLPIVRAALPMTQNAASIIVIMFRWAAGGAAALGGMQAVSGASTVITNPLNVRGTNGRPFSLRLTTAPDQAHYWLSDPLPAGLELTGTPGFTLWKIEGTPAVEGMFIVSISAKDSAGSGAGLTTSETLFLNIVSPSNAPPPPVFNTGTYNGLFYDSNDIQQASSGFFTVSVRSSGDFTARLQNGMRKFTFKGRFDPDGRTTNQVSRPGSSGLTAELNIDEHDGNRITGRVTDGVWSSGLLAHRAVFNSKTNPATSLTGRYTLVIPGAMDGASAPFGDGFGSVKIDAAGTALLTGNMADGSRVMQRVGLSGAGEWPLYVSLYSGKGSVFGWLRVRSANDAGLDGVANWIRPPGRLPKFYTNGFFLVSPVAGSLYTTPTGGIFETNSALVILSGGNLVEAMTNAVTLAAGGHVINAGTNQLTFSITPATGLFKGTVKPPNAKRPIRFQGAVLHGMGMGGGYFLGTNEIGNVYFGP